MAMSDNIVPDPDREGRHAFLCPSCVFVSTGWPTKTSASQRGQQHLTEHESGEPMPELLESGINGATGA